MMRILALPGSTPGHATADYRIVYPLKYLAAKYGVEFRIDSKTTLGDIAGYDLVVFQRQEILLAGLMRAVRQSSTMRVGTPWSQGGMAWADEKAVATTHQVSRRVIFDIDDDAINVPFHNPNYLMWGKDKRRIAEVIGRLRANTEQPWPEMLRENPAEVAMAARANLTQLLKNIRTADMLTVSTPWLSEVYAPYQKKRRVLPNYAEPTEWDGLGPEPHEGIHLGWSGGPTHFDDLRILAGPLKQIMEEYPSTKLIIAGYPEVKEFLFGNIPEDRVITHPFSRDWRRHLTTFDIILAPSDACKFNRGKSAIRIYQGLLATRGTAAVCASETTYGETVRRLRCGYVCKNTKDWLRYLKRLIEDKGHRQSMGNWGYTRMMKHETYEANAHKWFEVYEGVLNG